jgi:hypothetical protein
MSKKRGGARRNSCQYNIAHALYMLGKLGYTRARKRTRQSARLPTHKQTHTQKYAILIFAARIVSQTRLNVTLYVHCFSSFPHKFNPHKCNPTHAVKVISVLVRQYHVQCLTQCKTSTGMKTNSFPETNTLLFGPPSRKEKPTLLSACALSRYGTVHS